MWWFAAGESGDARGGETARSQRTAETRTEARKEIKFMAHVKRLPLQDVMEDESAKVLQRPLLKECMLRPNHRYRINCIIDLSNYVDEEHRCHRSRR